MKKILVLIFLSLPVFIFSKSIYPDTKREYYEQIMGKPYPEPRSSAKVAAYDDRKRSVLDKGNMVLRLSNAAIYGYDRWGLNHEFPAGSMISSGCCTYYWTQAPIVGAKINGQPSVSVGVRGSVRDSEEEFEPLPGYDSGTSDSETNVGIAFSDMEESWPTQWPIETALGDTFISVIYDANLNVVDSIKFPGVEPDLGPEGFPDAPCGFGVQADREAYFVVTDNDPKEGNTFASNGGVGPLNVRIDVWVLNYANTFGNDGLVFIQKMTNVGQDTLKDVFFGIAGDPDAPEQGSAEWTDDLCMMIPPNDPLIAEKLVDTTDAHLLGNLAIVWDPDDESSGFLSSGIGWVGLKFLECTKYSHDGTSQSYDVSNFFTYAYSDDAQSDADAYNTQLMSGIQEPMNIEPRPNDIFQKPYTYGPDVTWVISAGGPERVTESGETIPAMNMAPGEYVIFTFADFMGINESDLLRNAKVFQSLYDNDCASPKPPQEPVVHAAGTDSKVALFWDSRSENSIDPVTGNNAFQGYRVYRSTDRGISWGSVVTDMNGDPTDIYKPLQIYDVLDNVSGAYVMNDPLIYYNLGNNTGLQYSFVDENVINGIEYWYAVAAFDGPDDWAGAAVDPLENAKQKNAFLDGDNTVAIIPQNDPAGFEASEFEIVKTGNSFANLDAIPVDAFSFSFIGESEVNESDLMSKGYDYRVAFHEAYSDIDTSSGTDTSRWDTTFYNYWTMVSLDDNGSIIDTVVAEETDIETGEEKYIIDGFIPVFSDAIWKVESADTVYSHYSNAGSSHSLGTLGDNSSGASSWGDFMKYLYYTYPNMNGLMRPDGYASQTDLGHDFEIRYSAIGSIASWFTNGHLTGATALDTLQVPLEIWDVEDSNNPTRLGVAIRQVVGSSKPDNYWVLDSAIVLDTISTEMVIDTLYVEDDTTYDTSMVYGFDTSMVHFYIFDKNTWILPVHEPYTGEAVSLHPQTDASKIGWITTYNRSDHHFNFGDTMRFEIPNPVVPGNDEFVIKTTLPNYTTKGGDLDNVLVVPNPYKVTSAYQFGPYEREIQFTNLPAECMIRIYTVNGDLVQAIHHAENSIGYRGLSVEAWDLRTYNNQEVAFGVYLYHIVSGGLKTGQEHVGKFAVIK
jgi:hypothetical protein